MFSLASIATISACIFLFCLFFALVANINYGTRMAENTVGISVFFDESLSQEEIETIGQEIGTWREVREMRFTSAEEAWDTFKAVSYTHLWGKIREKSAFPRQWKRGSRFGFSVIIWIQTAM